LIEAGVDEVGRGPLAGPVVSAAVILDSSLEIDGLDDSKKLSEKKRLELSRKIKESAIAWNLASASIKEIDSLNILQASLLSMKRAVEGLKIIPEKVVCDGNYKPDISIECEAIIKGDSSVKSIMAASIIAKVTRDELMKDLDKIYPAYGFKKHKGYPTKFHLDALKLLGPCKIHRLSFKPVKESIKLDLEL
jgi:ribonuclease HII